MEEAVLRVIFAIIFALCLTAQSSALAKWTSVSSCHAVKVKMPASPLQAISEIITIPRILQDHTSLDSPMTVTGDCRSVDATPLAASTATVHPVLCDAYLFEKRTIRQQRPYQPELQPPQIS